MKDFFTSFSVLVSVFCVFTMCIWSVFVMLSTPFLNIWSQFVRMIPHFIEGHALPRWAKDWPGWRMMDAMKQRAFEGTTAMEWKKKESFAVSIVVSEYHLFSCLMISSIDTRISDLSMCEAQLEPWITSRRRSQRRLEDDDDLTTDFFCLVMRSFVHWINVQEREVGVMWGLEGRVGWIGVGWRVPVMVWHSEQVN